MVSSLARTSAPLAKVADITTPLQRAGAGFLSGAVPGAALGGLTAVLTAPKDEERLGRRALTGATIGGLAGGGLNAARHGIGYSRALKDAESFFKKNVADVDEIRKQRLGAIPKPDVNDVADYTRYRDDLRNAASAHDNAMNYIIEQTRKKATPEPTFLESAVARLRGQAKRATLQRYGLNKTADYSPIGLPSEAQRALMGFLAGALPGAAVGAGVGYFTAKNPEERKRRALISGAIGATAGGGLGAAYQGYAQHLLNQDAVHHMFSTPPRRSEAVEALRNSLEEAMDRQREHAANAAASKGTFWERPHASWAEAAARNAEKIKEDLSSAEAQHMIEDLRLRHAEALEKAQPVPTYLETLYHAGADAGHGAKEHLDELLRRVISKSR